MPAHKYMYAFASAGAHRKIITKMGKRLASQFPNLVIIFGPRRPKTKGQGPHSLLCKLLEFGFGLPGAAGFFACLGVSVFAARLPLEARWRKRGGENISEASRKVETASLQKSRCNCPLAGQPSEYST